MILSSNPKLHDHSLRIIIPFVVAVHFLIAFLLTGLNREVVPLVPKKGVVVHSVKLQPKVNLTQEIKKDVVVNQAIKVPEIKPQEVKPVPQKPLVEKKPEKVAPKPQPVQPKKQVMEKKKPVPTPVPKIEKVKPEVEKVKPDNKEWIARAKEKIGKIAPPSDNIVISSQKNLKEIATPATIENFVTDLAFIDSGTSFNVKESAYRDELGQRLKLYLKLPEYGEVKVKLTIDRSGKIIATKILSFQSAKNASFIEQNLPKLKMPPFGDNFKGVSDHDFTIILSNE